MLKDANITNHWNTMELTRIWTANNWNKYCNIVNMILINCHAHVPSEMRATEKVFEDSTLVLCFE